LKLKKNDGTSVRLQLLWMALLFLFPFPFGRREASLHESDIRSIQISCNNSNFFTTYFAWNYIADSNVEICNKNVWIILWAVLRPKMNESGGDLPPKPHSPRFEPKKILQECNREIRSWIITSQDSRAIFFSEFECSYLPKMQSTHKKNRMESHKKGKESGGHRILPVGRRSERDHSMDAL